MKWTLALLLLVALGCSNDADALYTRSADVKDSGMPGAAKPEPLPALPALPDEDRQPECTRCAKSTCSEARANCLEDDDCTDELRCKGACNNPACLQQCTAEFGWSPWYTDYENCVFGLCQTECNTGHNWQCGGNYEWPAATTSSFKVRFNFSNPPNYFLGSQMRSWVAGQTVRACSDASDCSDPIDSAEAGIDNTVTLELDASSIPPRDFRGYLEIEESNVRIYPPPLARAQENFSSFYPASNYPGPQVVAIAVDCLAFGAPGVQISLPEMPNVAPLYWQNDLSLVPGEATAPAGIAVMQDLPVSAVENKVRVRATRVDTHEVLEDLSIWLRAGFSTQVALGAAPRNH